MQILRWFIFNILIALTPLAFALILLSSKAHGQRTPLLLAQVLGDGELFLVTTAISAEAIGNVIGTGNDLMGLKLISAGSCVLTLMFSVFFYGVKATSRAGEFAVVTPSLILYGITLLAAFSCKVLATLAENDV